MSQIAFPGFRATSTTGASNTVIPLPGAKLRFDEAGTTTLRDVYTDAAHLTPHTNPVVADADGYFPIIYWAPDDYKVTLLTTADVEVWDNPIDDWTVPDPATATAVASQTITSNTNVAAADLDRMFNIDASSGDITLTADSAALGSGFRFSARLSVATNDGIIAVGGGQTINGASTFTLDNLYDAASFVSNGAGGWDIISQTLDTATLVSDNAIQKIQVALTAGRFEYKNTTNCTLAQKRGCYVCFPDGASIIIPSGGLDIDNSGLSNDTLYYCYASYSGSTLALEFSATGHSVDTVTGIEIQTGDATKVLVGMVQYGTAQFDDGATARNVASWHNRRGRTLRGLLTTTRTVASGAENEINSEIRCGFVGWADAMTVAFSAEAAMPADNDDGGAAVSLDGATPTEVVMASSYGSGGQVSPTMTDVLTPAEGYHYITAWGKAVGGIATYQTSCVLSGVVVI